VGDNEKSFCCDHTEKSERIKGLEVKCIDHEKRIENLFSEFHSNTEMLHSINITMQSMNDDMKHGFFVATSEIGSLKSAFTDRSNFFDQLIKDSVETMEALDVRIKETKKDLSARIKKADDRIDILDQFDWFRKPMNKLNRNLPVFIVGLMLKAIGGFVILMAVLHWREIGTYAIKWLVGIK